MLLVADPAIGTVFLAETIFGRMRSRLEQLRLLGLDLGKVVRVDMRPPERRVLQIFFGTVAEQARDVVADESGGEVPARRKAVDDRGSCREQQVQSGAHFLLRLLR